VQIYGKDFFPYQHRRKSMRKFLLSVVVMALPFVASCDNQRGEQRMEEGKVIERDATVIDQQPGQLQEREVERGSKDVEYTTKRRVTETVLREQNIPTIQICETKADINAMDQAAFRALGFDQQTAQRIVQAREQRGRFNSVDELGQVQGVPSGTLSQVRGDLGVAPRQAEEE
jgi:DNA uptake protein ComE-like DNA-binding protein